VVVAEHGSEESNEQLDLVRLEKVLVEAFEGRGEEADGLGPGNRIAAIAVVLARGYPKFDRCCPVANGNSTCACILDF